MKALSAIGGGLAGAVAVTLIHESVRRLVPEAPRMDLLGMEAISKGIDAAGGDQPGRQALFNWAMAGDIVTNAMYYSIAGIGKDKNIWLKSSMLGLAAGLGAVSLPAPLGLDPKHSNRSLQTQLMTVGLYVAGSLVTAAVLKLLSTNRAKRTEARSRDWERKLVTSAMS